jgi:hypothetical protein
MPINDRNSPVPTLAAQPVFARRTLLVAIGLTISFAGLLWLESRPLWCKYGLGFWTGAWTNCTSQHLLDPYTFSHVLHGIIFYWFLWFIAPNVAIQWRMIWAMTIEVGWELLENSPWVIERYRQQTASLDYTGDSIINSLGDLLATAAGFYVASRVSWKAAVVIYIAFELGMLWVARDNLTLNVLMLFFPLEAVKQWQMQAM